jgi:hypothetical protein
MTSLAWASRLGATPFNVTFDNYGAILPYSDSKWAAATLSRSVIVADDRKVDATVKNTPGAIGINMYDVNLSVRIPKLC